MSKLLFCYVDWRLDDWTPFYVGIGNEARYNLDLRNNFHIRIARKFGAIRQVIYYPSTWEDACVCEIRMISEFNTFHGDNSRGANFTRGGEGVLGYKQSIEVKKRIGEYNTKFRRGSKNGMFGRKNPNAILANQSRRGKPGKQLFGAANPNFGKKGTKAVKAKLNEEQVKQIQNLLPQLSNHKIAKLFNVSASTISRIRSGISSYLEV